MTDKEKFKKENKLIARFIKEGLFLNAKNAKQGSELGKMISEGLASGIKYKENKNK